MQAIESYKYIDSKEGTHFTPSSEMMQKMLDSIPDGFVYTRNDAIYTNKAAKELWGLEGNSFDLPFDADDPNIEEIIAVLAMPYPITTQQSIHEVYSITPQGERIPTTVTIERTPKSEMIIQITDKRSGQFAKDTRAALHKLNNVAATLIGGAELAKVDKQVGEEFVAQGIADLDQFTKDTQPLHDRARKLEDPTPSHTSRPLSFPAF